MAHLALALLGPFQATLDGRPVEGLNSDRLRALLAYLAVERGREHPREQVASLLWPERPDREALSALRFALSKLHAALGDRGAPSPFLLVSRNSVQFNTASDHRLDVAEFESLAGSGRGDPAPTDLSGLVRAASLYRGPFLHGLSVAGSPDLDDWLLMKDEELLRAVLSVLGRLTSLHAAGGDYAEAARWARRQLELEPYREQAHRQLMAALALAGERTAALAHYEACRRVLAQELGCEPDDETKALYAQIRDGTLAAGGRGDSELPPVGRRGEIAAPALAIPERSGVDAIPASPRLPFPVSPPLPITASRFVAREQELAHLHSLLDRALAGRGGVALIAGEAGSGKTALLDELARRATQAHGDLIALRGSCNAHGGAGDPYLPFREMLQTLAGDVEGKPAGGAFSPEQARRSGEALPALGAALAEYGPDLIGAFVPGEALLRRAEGFAGLPGAAGWQARLRDTMRRSGDATAPAPQPDLFAQVTRVLHAVSAKWPLLLAIDDLQWADGGTAALLFHLGRRLAGSRMLLACAYRPEALQPSAGLRGLADLGGLGPILQELARQWGDVLVDLDRADGRAFVEAYVDSEPNRLGAEFRQALYDHTGGNPLFTVELLRSFERDGSLVQDEAGRWVPAAAGGPDWERWPPQVETLIAGHLAGLPDEDRAVLQAASVQGEQFIAEVAARVLRCGEEDLVERLSGPLRTRHRLVEADRLERLPSSGQCLSRYRFRHALLQRCAYGSLDRVARARLHEATARALEAIYGPAGQAEGERPEVPPPLAGSALAPALARHYEAAGMPLQAARALHDAGRQATRLSAFREALIHFDHGLALLADEPPSPERSEIERLLQAARLLPRRGVDGTGSSRLEGALAQAFEAGAGKAQGRTRLMTLEAQASHLSSRGRLAGVLAVAEQMLELATEGGQEGLAAHAYWWFGFAHHFMGDASRAESYFDWIFARLRPGGWAEVRAAVGYDITVHALTFSGINQWFLGSPEQARRRNTQAVTRALELGDLYAQPFASACGCTTLFLLRSDVAELQEQAELCQRVCAEQGLASWRHFAEVLLGWLAVMRGEDVAGIERMQLAIAAWQDAGMVVGTDALSVVLADGCLAAAKGRLESDDEQRARWLAIGLAVVEGWIGPEVPCGQAYQAELHRLRGELLLARDGLSAAGEALGCFGRALALGREKGALAWELRAAMSLVRLREHLGEANAAELAEARQCLREVYGRFKEGFAFPDLRDAAALIGDHPRPGIGETG